MYRQFCVTHRHLNGRMYVWCAQHDAQFWHLPKYIELKKNSHRWHANWPIYDDILAIEWMVEPLLCGRTVWIDFFHSVIAASQSHSPTERDYPIQIGNTTKTIHQIGKWNWNSANSATITSRTTTTTKSIDRVHVNWMLYCYIVRCFHVLCRAKLRRWDCFSFFFVPFRIECTDWTYKNVRWHLNSETTCDSHMHTKVFVKVILLVRGKLFVRS